MPRFCASWWWVIFEFFCFHRAFSLDVLLSLGVRSSFKHKLDISTTKCFPSFMASSLEVASCTNACRCIIGQARVTTWLAATASAMACRCNHAAGRGRVFYDRYEMNICGFLNLILIKLWWFHHLHSSRWNSICSTPDRKDLPVKKLNELLQMNLAAIDKLTITIQTQV